MREPQVLEPSLHEPLTTFSANTHTQLRSSSTRKGRPYHREIGHRNANCRQATATFRCHLYACRTTHSECLRIPVPLLLGRFVDHETAIVADCINLINFSTQDILEDMQLELGW